MNSIILWLKNKFWTEQWNIGVFRGSQKQALQEDPTNKKIQWLFPEKKDGFYADPFLIEHEGKQCLFFEEFDNATQRGSISYSILHEAGDSLRAAQPRIAISKPFHMSYPFLFKHEGALYMIPETAQANEVALYKPARFPEVWMKTKTIISNFPAIDPTMVFWKGKFWLFCTHQKSGENSELHIFFADELFGPWQPHQKNPVKMDLKGSRPGGSFFEKDGKLFRYAQDCSKTYGGSLVLNKINKLTEEDFSEEIVKNIKPNSSENYDKGLHTLNFGENWTVVDGKRFSGLKRYLNDYVQSAKRRFNKS
jgi:hypothetical protein